MPDPIMDILGKIAAGEVSYILAVMDPATNEDHYFFRGAESTRIGLLDGLAGIVENQAGKSVEDKSDEA